MSSKPVTIESIESIYRKRAADFFRLALARASDPELAREAVHEAFARAIRARAGFRGSKSLEAWICRCVLNATRDSRLLAVEHELREADGIVGIPETPDATVRAAVRQLSTRECDALFLRFYLDLDYLTIAEALGIEIEAVPTTLHAARKNLTQALEEVAG